MFFASNDDERDIDLSEEETVDTDELDDSDEPDEADGSEDDDGTAGEDAQDDEPGEEPHDDGAAETKDTFHVKWLDETRDLTREEVIQYAQKGMDYDRTKEALRASREEAATLREFHQQHKSQIDELTAYMEETGAANLDEVLDNLRVSALVGKGESKELAREKVRSARLERQLAAKSQQQTAQEQKNRKAQEDLAAFQKEYPDVKVDEALLKELGEDLKATGNLTRAYEKMQRRKLEADNEKLRKQLEADKQNASNKRRSTGSQKSSGSSSAKKDPLLAALLSDD